MTSSHLRWSSLVILLAQILASSAARANDSWVMGVGGSWFPIRGEHPSVRMVRESVTIDVYARRYVTVARFLFQNSGPAVTVSMGFPERGGPGSGKTSGFLQFATWVDGKRVKARRVYDSYVPDDEYDAYWVKSVPFAPGQARAVTVRYEAPIGTEGDGQFPHFVAYAFTGRNWRGDVAESLLKVVFRTRPPVAIRAVMDNQPVQPLKGGPTTRVYRWMHWQAEGWFQVQFGR